MSDETLVLYAVDDGGATVTGKGTWSGRGGAWEMTEDYARSDRLLPVW